MDADLIHAQQQRGEDNHCADGDPGGGDRIVGNPAQQQADDGDVDFADHVDQRYRRGPAGALDLLVLVGRDVLDSRSIASAGLASAFLLSRQAEGILPLGLCDDFVIDY